MGRDTNEKITDGARGMFEKMTGYVYFLSIHNIFPLHGVNMYGGRVVKATKYLVAFNNIDGKYSC
jgi:hypothetical protein